MSVLGAHEQAPITIADTQGTVSAQGILTSTGSLASLEITAVANAAGDGSFAYKRATVQGGSGRTNFQLSPMTAVIFTAQSVLTGRTTQGGDWAVASAWIDLETYIDGEPVSTQNYKSLNSYYDLPFGSDVFTETQHDTLQVTYANTSLGITETAFGAGVYGNADSFLTPVPEPSVYAMLMAGLGLVACVSRRRGRSAT
ncbi:putative secreted protein with PEP-CTERM sorting signal [Pseudoduganella lurida]|uniref:Putative secreted protein with PEP-CTERM sorting signal n=2 Tax=Pseudoduganella lurida TaxID=1036180 RepID=A0A562QX50_9BURK|nr:putative secreted protein with PEP-CTERM sorting signal [Pseudoduganella lurida]